PYPVRSGYTAGYTPRQVSWPRQRPLDKREGSPDRTRRKKRNTEAAARGPEIAVVQAFRPSYLQKSWPYYTYAKGDANAVSALIHSLGRKNIPTPFLSRRPINPRRNHHLSHSFPRLSTTISGLSTDFTEGNPQNYYGKLASGDE